MVVVVVRPTICILLLQCQGTDGGGGGVVVVQHSTARLLSGNGFQLSALYVTQSEYSLFSGGCC